MKVKKNAEVAVVEETIKPKKVNTNGCKYVPLKTDTNEPSINCSARYKKTHCFCCGFNPSVAKRRLQQRFGANVAKSALEISVENSLLNPDYEMPAYSV